jgi:hypothetical protein
LVDAVQGAIEALVRADAPAGAAPPPAPARTRRRAAALRATVFRCGSMTMRQRRT